MSNKRECGLGGPLYGCDCPRCRKYFSDYNDSLAELKAKVSELEDRPVVYGPCRNEPDPVVLSDEIIQRMRDVGDKEMSEDRMLKWFEWEHLPAHLQQISKPFGELAEKITYLIDSGPERTVALRKLLEAKDAAVRAAVKPGG